VEGPSEQEGEWEPAFDGKSIAAYTEERDENGAGAEEGENQIEEGNRLDHGD
jgi:hypothetical protein